MVFSNVTGTDSQNFNPTPDGLDYLTVHSGKNLSQGQFNLGLFMDHAINSLPYFKADNANQSRDNFNDGLTSGVFHFAYGILDNLSLGLSLPFLIDQSIYETRPDGFFEKPGITDAKIFSKWIFWHNESLSLGTAFSINFVQIENYPYSGINAYPTYNLELIQEFYFGDLSLAINEGVRIRSPGEKISTYPITPYQNQLIGSAAVGYTFIENHRLYFEVFGSSPVGISLNDIERLESNIESLLGYRYTYQDYEFHLASSTEIIHGTATPDWRFIGGFNWKIGKKVSEENPLPESSPAPIEENIPSYNIPTTNLPEENFLDVTLDDSFTPKNPSKFLEESNTKTVSANDKNPFAQMSIKNADFIVHDLHFKLNSDEMVGNQNEFFHDFVKFLEKSPKLKKLTIDGHTCDIGSTQYNKKLSERRARKIKNVLVEKYNIPANKIVIHGYGKKRPLYSNTNEKNRQLNRRVEFHIERSKGNDTLSSAKK